MPLRVAFDLDGVLADMESELVRQAGLVFGEAMAERLRKPVPPRPTAAAVERDKRGNTDSDHQADTTPPLDSVPIATKLDMTARQQRRLWRHIASVENFWEALDELEPGVVARLSVLARDRRWEIIFLTKRPETMGATAQVQSQRWLESKGFTLPSVYVVQGSRGLIAAALGLDIVIDDRPENCLDVVADSKARAILVWRDQNQVPVAAQRLGIGTVKSVGDCLDILTQIDTPESEDRSSVMDRVKRLLGLKKSAEV